MAIKEKKKKVSSSGMSTKEKMLARKKALEAKGNNSGFVICKKGVTRIRIKSPGPDEELGIELIQFYLGNGIGTIISPQTFGEPCPIMEKYDELRNSDSDEDKELAKLMVPNVAMLSAVWSMKTKKESMRSYFQKLSFPFRQIVFPYQHLAIMEVALDCSIVAAAILQASTRSLFTKILGMVQ